MSLFTGAKSSPWGSFNQPLTDAYNAIDRALKPREIIRPLTPTDILTAEKALEEWETSNGIGISVYGPEGDPLVDWMVLLCHYASALPDVPGTDRTPQLRERFVRLESRIQRALLEEQRKEKKADLRSGENADVKMLHDWGQEIREQLLAEGMRSEHWACTTLPRIFDHLEAFDDLTLSMLQASKLPLVMHDIVHAPCIPLVSNCVPFRARAGACLRQWASLPGVLALESAERASIGLAVDDLVIMDDAPSLPQHSGSELVYRLDEVSAALRRIQNCAAAGDADTFVRVVADIENWGIPESTLAGSLIYPLRTACNALRKAARSPSTEATRRVEKLLDLYGLQGGVRPQRRIITGFSHRSATNDAPDVPASIRVCFRDMGWYGHEPWTLEQYGMRSDPRVWADVSIDCSPSKPLHAMLGQFFAEANTLNRHPLSPVTEFCISASKESLTPGNRLAAGSVWRTGPGKFAQGCVTAFAHSDTVIYYVRYDGNFALEQSKQIMVKPPSQRVLPESCANAPSHWYRPPPPSGLASAWERIPSMAFVGSGIDIWPHATYPPLIASHVYIPKSFEPLGLNEWLIRSHNPTPVDQTPVKLYLPLTPEQAKSLVGRTVQYEDPTVDALPPKKRARTNEGTSVDNPIWDRVFCAFVWGLDPERMELKAFASSVATEVCRTFMIGTPRPLAPLPADYPPLCVPFAPLWIGAVKLPDTTMPTDVPPPPTQIQPGEDRLSLIIDKAPREFEVGIGEDHVLLAGELGVQDPESVMIEKIENCKAGIWESGRNADDDEDADFLIWVQWVRDGSIDLAQSVEDFANATDHSRSLPAELVWRRATYVSVDGGSVALLARGITSEESIQALAGEDDIMDVASFVECIVLPGHEDDKFHILGGIASRTGSDGTFAVDVAVDEEDKVVAVKVTGPTFTDE